jgi:hypothetical protein
MAPKLSKTTVTSESLEEESEELRRDWSPYENNGFLSRRSVSKK